MLTFQSELYFPMSTNENSPTEIPSKSLKSFTTHKEVVKTSYHKLKTFSSSGEWIFPEQKNFYDDLNTIIHDQKLIEGRFKGNDVDVFRSYITCGSRNSLKLLHSKIQSHEVPQAQICIIHGLDGHSGRYLSVFLY